MLPHIPHVRMHRSVRKTDVRTGLHARQSHHFYLAHFVKK